MTFDLETEEGRALWTRFRCLSIALAYQHPDMAKFVVGAAQMLAITDKKDIDAMIQACADTGRRLQKTVEPFCANPSLAQQEKPNV